MPFFLAAIVLLVILAGGASAQEREGMIFPNKPDKSTFYVDEAGLINPQDGQAVNKIAEALLREQRIPIIVVTIRSLAGHNAADYTIERYAFELFNRWGIGSESRNYGMLLLVSAGDRRARIELGAAWGASHDYKAQEVMNNSILPSFREGRFSEGILAGVKGMDAIARGLALPKPKQPWWTLPLMIGVAVLIVGLIISLFKSGHKGWGFALIAFLGVLIFFFLRAAAKGSGSGGAFSGGFSGGGGASGSW
jgi:uncharacterized protein